MKIVEMIIDPNDEQSGIEALKEVDAEKKILMGAALIPDKSIYRRNEKDEEYYIYFSKKTVRQASELYFKNSNHQNATFEHKDKVQNTTVVESWIVEDSKKDKTALHGLNVPVGTWVVSMKIDDEELYTKAKSGEIKGFSIEGFFSDRYDMSKDDKKTETINKLKDLLK